MVTAEANERQAAADVMPAEPKPYPPYLQRADRTIPSGGPRDSRA
jgi:hypothetical protein